MNNELNTETANFVDSMTVEGRYRLLIESIRDYAIYMLDREGNITNWNAGAERFKGYKANEIIGKHFSTFYTEEDKAANLPLKALASAERYGVFETEGWRVRKGGERFWAHVIIDPIRDRGGKLVGFAKVTRDITERKRAQTALQKSEDLLSVLVQGVSDYAIYMIDPDGLIANWNLGAARIKGYSAEEIVGKHFSVFFTEEDRAAGEPQRAIETAKREGKYEREAWRVRKDGTPFRAHVVLNAIRDKDGELIGLIKITRDETERHKAQEALDQAREALFQSQKTEAIGKLTGGVAHDFNNLLAVVIGNLELLRKRLADDKLSALVDNALLGAKRGAALTQRMLVFARRTELTKVPVDIPSLVHGMSEIFRRSIGSEIVLETRFPVGLPAVLTDPHQLETALLNLVVNARDAIEGGGTIVIGGRSGQPGGGNKQVHVYVTDSGAGMDNETLRRAGEPFFTTKGVGKGTGLGLSMVQGLAEQSGGKINIFSKIGQGTTVELLLPAAPEQEAVPSEAVPKTFISTGDPMSILVVDDDMLVLMGTKAMLEDLGHTVVSANSGADALRILKERSDIDLLITDQAMPQMTGLALAHEAKALHPELPIVIATGYAELPENGFPITRLAKPYLQEDLRAAIAEAKAQRGP